MLVGLKLDPARTHLISGFVDTYLELDKAEEQEFRAGLEEIMPTAKEEVMQIVTSWMREGIEQGIEQGKRERELELLLRQLTRRFGPLSTELEGRVQQLSSAQIDELALALFDFSKLEDLVSWLDNPPAIERKDN